MYEYIKGTLTALYPEYAVIEANGVGYKIYIPINLYTNVLQLGNETLLYLSHVVREDSERLFGFDTKESRNFFEKLCSISGIGGKTALSLIGHMENRQLQVAIQTGNVKLLTHIPGIGKKTAERIIVELSDQIAKWSFAQKAPQEGPTELFSDAFTALLNLGYNQPQAQKAVQKALDESDASLTLSRLITTALRHI
jgi:Holliday junction DNA helicase RuvA